MSWLDTMATNAGINKDYTQHEQDTATNSANGEKSLYDKKLLNIGPFNFSGKEIMDASQSLLDSAASVYGNIAYEFGNPYGIGDTLRNYAQQHEQAMGENTQPGFNYDYIMNGGLLRDTGTLAGSVLSLAPVGAAAAGGAAALGASAPVVGAVGGIASALGEAAAEGGGTLADSLAQGLSLDEAESRAREVTGKNALFLGATNALSGGMMGKFLKGVAQNLAGKGAEKLAGGIANQSGLISQGTKETLKGAGTLGMSALNEGFQEAEQDAISASVDPNKYASYNPVYWSDEQWEDFNRTLGPTALMGLVGGAGGNASYNYGLARQNETQEAEQSGNQANDMANTAATSIPAQANYTIADEVSDANLSQGTESKLRMLDEAYYKQYGQHLYVTSMTRHWGTNSDHETGSAFDVADDGLANDGERRQWIAEKARQLGLNPLDEYENPSSGATGGHMHFSDKGGAVNVDTSGWSGNADIDSLIADTANRYGIDANLLAAIAEQESGFNQGAKSEAGALGIMQLMPDTANGLGVDANDLAGNIEGGAKYIKQMLDQFGGDLHKALEAYNGGPGGVGNAETMKYADEVMQRYEKFKAKSAGTFSWSKPAGTNTTTTTTTDYMKIMSDNNVTADTAGDFLQYVRLLAEDDANANNEQVQKDGAKAVKAIADGSPDAMERVAKELGYGQVKQEVEQEAPNIPIPKIRQHVQQNGWVEIGNKKDADEFAKTDYGKTLERVSNTRFVSPDFNAITGRVEQRTAQPQQVAQPSPQPTVQNKVQPDVAQMQNKTEEKQKRNDKPLSAGEVNILNSIAQKMPQAELRIIAQHMRNGEYNTVRGIIQQYNPEASLIADNVGKAIAIARNLLGNPMATQNKSGTRIDVKKAERILKGRNLDVINRLNLSMGRNLKSNGEPMSAGLKFPSPDRSVENVERARVAAAKVAEIGIPYSGEVGSNRGAQAPAVEEIKFPEPKLEEDNIPTGLKAKLNKVANNLSAENANTAENTLAKTKQTGKPAVNPTEELFDTNNVKKNTNTTNENDSKPQKKPAEGKSSQNEPMPPQKASDGENAISLKNIEGFTDRDLKEAEKMGISFTSKGRLVDGKPVYDIEFASQKDADKFVREFFGEVEDGDVTQEIKAAGKENAKENEIDENIKNGKKAIKSILENHKDVPKAMYRDEVGYIDFVYGKEGTIKKDRSDGYGLAKILEKHGQEAVSKIPEVIAKGKYEKSEYGDRAYFLFDGYRAVIRFTWDGDKKTWLVTNFLDNKKKDSGDADAFVRSAPTTDGTTSPSEQNPSMDSIPQSKENLNIVVTDDGKEFKIAYKVMPAEDVVASNLPTDGLPVNKDYPSAMQPRNRQRAAMQEQITSMSNNLRPADLTESRNLNQGAPVIKPDGAVLNGNGRTIAIQRAWLNGKADKYKQYLLDNAEKLGINPADIENVEHPILVRVVQDKLSKDDIMSMINSTTGGQRMSPSEQAKVDSKKIKASTLNKYVVGSDVTAAANRSFLRDVLADIVAPSERNAYYSREGAINQDGVLRAQRALFALAYGDDTLLDAFSEAVNEEAKNFSNALKANAPLVARLQQLINSGNANELGLQKNLTAAVKALKGAVLEGKPAQAIWQEMSMFENTEHSPETIAIAKVMDGYRRSGKKLTQFVRNLAELGLKHGNPNQSGLFGENEAPQIKLTDDIATAKEYVDTGKQMDLFTSKYSRDKNSRSAFSSANPDTAEELKATGNIDTPLDRLPKLPASKLRDSERKMQAFGKAIGVPVHFVNHPDKGYRGVFTHNGEVYINRNATVPAKAIFLHEFTHWLKASGKENRAVFDALAACVERDGGLFHERRLKQYRDRIFGGEQMTDEEIIEEIICDAMGNSKTAERISKAIDNFAPELNQSIWGRIKAMWDKFCQMVGFRQELSSKKQSLPNGLSQQEMAKFNAQLNILMSKMRTADGKPMFKIKDYQLVVAENGKRPAEIFDINNINDYVPTYNIPPMPSSFSYQVHTQREAVRQQYEGTKEWMKAPNGEPTNLTEEQWLDVRTPNFKAWFGDWENNPDEASKVVDENGEPLVVYHGSESNFDEFDTAKARANMDIQGMFFSPIQEEANDYGENVRAFFLNIKNPADYDTGYNALKNHKGENLAGEKARNDLMENGYDGVNNDGEEYIAFNPNQIKSATENTGAFSPNTNNIKYSRPDTETARLDSEYMSLVDEFNNAESDEKKQAAHDKLVKLVEQAAEKAGFKDAIPEQTPAYQIRTKAAPKKSVKVYKVFTMSDDGKPTALFIGGTEKLPQGVWLDAVAAYNFVAKNGKSYVPSTQNPYTKGGKTGASVEIPSEEVRQELINRGFLPEGSTAKKITALAYRPGWHAGTMPFFPQGGKKPAKGEKTNYENIHRYNQVVFECELAADKDYTAEAEAQPKARTKTGKLNTKNADLQYMPEDGFYYYATNPMTHGHPELGMWAISGSLKINKALTQEECDKILTDNNLLPQEWEGGEMSLEKLGYTGEENDAARKTLAPITYDDDGNVIPLSQRFDITNPDVRYSRDRAGITASTDNVGIFKRAMMALENKLKGKMPDNLDVRTYEDIEADKENARRAKAISRGKEHLDRSKEVSPFEMWWASPSRLAKKIPLISPFVQMAKIAVDKQEKLRVEFNSGMNEIEDMLGYSKWGSNDKKYKERKMALQEALLQGDIAHKVFTDDELERGGLDEQTIKAYHKMRELLDKAYNMADQTYSRTKYVSRNWSTAAEADGFMNDLMKKNPFVQIIQKKQNTDGTVTYTYKEPHQYTVSALTVTEAELDELKKNKDVIITSEKHIYGDMFGNSTYRVTYHQKKANLGKIQGYIPHIFHGWLVCEVDKNGNIIKDSAGNIVVVTSKNSMTEAVKEGKKIAGQNADKHYMVVPKLSKFNDGAAERAAIMGDFDYSKTMSKVANGMKMSIADAEKFMNGTVAVQNRGRFLAYAQHRKGVQGYEQNVFLATQMYFNQIARYVALDPFKRDAISTYNRLFGNFTDNAVMRRSRNAKYIYEYINDMNGVPNGVEMWMNDMLHNMGLGQEVANGRPGLWLEHMFIYPFTIAKLGILNMSSALLNLTQLFNLYGAMGEKVLSSAGYERLIKKGFVDARKAITNKNSPLGQLVWKDLGLEAQIGIDVAGGYSKTEVSGLASLTGRLSKLAGGSMYLFRLSDTYTRAVTLLTAYNKALDEGMTKQEAIEYAKEINDKVNFDYSIADSPGIFRAFGPLSKVLLQFKKYPVKQIELFMDIFNDGRAAGLNRKQSALRLMKYTAPYMAFSGMMGIPFISLAGGILSAIMSAATGDDDWDWQQKIKQYMVETFGADNPLTLWWLYGAGSFIGINVGSRVGVGDFMGIENREKSPIDSILGMTTATSTVAQTTKQLGYGNYAEAVKAVSPSAGNILIGLKGEVHTTRGRMKYQYQNAYEQALRMIGFNPLNETMAGDIASNDYANKQAEKRAKDDAIDAFIEEPTAENAARLNELGVTPKSIKTEMARRKMNRAELNRLAEAEKAEKAKKSKQKKKQYSVNDYLKGK